MVKHVSMTVGDVKIHSYLKLFLVFAYPYILAGFTASEFPNTKKFKVQYFMYRLLHVQYLEFKYEMGENQKFLIGQYLS